MDAAAAVLLVLLVLTWVAAAIVAIIAYHTHNKLVDQNASLRAESEQQVAYVQKKLAAMEADLNNCKSQPSSIGLAYKPKNSNIGVILASIQKVLTDSQLMNCNLVHSSFLEYKDKLIRALEDTATAAGGISCDWVSEVSGQLAGDIKQKHPDIETDALEKNMKELTVLVVTEICKDGKVSTEQLDALLTNVFDTICYK